MTIFKCKMCGGTLEFNEGDTVAVCDSCGTKQTLPKLDDDRKANLYDRANHFRRSSFSLKSSTEVMLVKIGAVYSSTEPTDIPFILMDMLYRILNRPWQKVPSRMQESCGA